jgi:3-oxoacyl-[acyl-carrier protein] reductase
MDEGPVAVITGAGRGIGRAAAVELASAGYRLTLVSRNADELNETARLAGGGSIVVADVKQADHVQQVIDETLRAYDGLEAVVHCAGLAPVKSIAQMTAQEWRDVIDTNLSAAFFLCHSAWPTFERQQSGVIVNLSSYAARDPFPGFAAYGSAKAGVNLLALSAAREGAPIGVRVHTIAPAAVETAMFRGILSEDQYPREKALSPADVAKVILQCVRGDLRYTSGEVIYLSKVRE